MHIEPDVDVVTVIERYDVQPSWQAEATRLASRGLREWINDLDFRAGLLLRSRDHTRGGLSTYVQWRVPGDGHRPAAVPAEWTLAPLLHSYPRLDARTYRVEFTMQSGSEDGPSSVRLKDTPFAHLGIFPIRRGEQDRMLDLNRRNVVTSLDTPGMVSVNFHRSVDGTQVVDLGIWSSLENQAQLLDGSGFRNDDLYWRKTVADFRPDFLDIVAIEVARTW